MFSLLLLLLIRFLTLLERNILGHAQSRVRPQKVRIIGNLQAIMDAVKLLLKNFGWGNNLVYFICGFFLLFISLYQWILIPFGYFHFSVSFLLFLFLSSIFVFPNVIIRWFSSNNYTLLRSIRAVIMIISYEVCFSFFFLLVCLVNFEYSWEILLFTSYKSLFFIFWFPFFLLLILCELGRIPFDLIEGESELVSRYNTEFSSRVFTLLFLSEYVSMLFFCLLLFLLFFNFFFFGGIFFSIMLFVLICVVRSALPRLKYYQVLVFLWRWMLPQSLVIIFFFLSLG